MNIVRELRKKKGIQQKELALIIGVAQPTVSDWEKNKKDPSDERLDKLAEYFGVDKLVILGKGVVDLTAEETKEGPVIDEADAQIFSQFKRLSPANRARMEAYLEGLLAGQEA